MYTWTRLRLPVLPRAGPSSHLTRCSRISTLRKELDRILDCFTHPATFRSQRINRTSTNLVPYSNLRFGRRVRLQENRRVHRTQLLASPAARTPCGRTLSSAAASSRACSRLSAPGWRCCPSSSEYRRRSRSTMRGEQNFCSRRVVITPPPGQVHVRTPTTGDPARSVAARSTSLLCRHPTACYTQNALKDAKTLFTL